jgi:two-component system sensor histidine kinase BaeS
VLGTSLLVVLSMGVADSWSFARGFVGYINGLTEERMRTVLPNLRQYYRETGSWAGVDGNRRQWLTLIHPQPELNPGSQGWLLPPSDLTGAVFRIVLLDADKQRVMGFVSLPPRYRSLPIEVDGQTVGYLAMAPFQSVTEAGGALLLKRQLLASLVVGTLALLLAALIAGWATRRLLTPVRQVAAATHRLAAGDYSERVQVQSDDEVGQLARDFNQLALTLERNEKMRRAFMADISHELRTPLAVLRGELEALEDGVRELDGNSLRSLQQEVGQMTKLVADLYELSLADVGALTYRKQPLDLVELLQQALGGAAERCLEHGLRLELQLPEVAMPVLGDAGRLRQLFGNLLENSLRYTESGGLLRIKLEAVAGRIEMAWEDSAPGVAGADLSRLFERFFRGEGSRCRASGGSGLGLAICRSIAEAHSGTLDARASSLGGLGLYLSLPREND